MPWGMEQQLQSPPPQTTRPYASKEWDRDWQGPWEWHLPIASKGECSHVWTGQRVRSCSVTESIWPCQPTPIYILSIYLEPYQIL